MNKPPFYNQLKASAATLASRFCGDRNGSLPVIFAVSALPALMLVGVAVDYSRSTGVLAQAQAAADAGALAAGALAASSADARLAAATNAVNAAMNTSGPSLNLQISQTDVTATTFKVTVSGTIPTVLGKIAGKNAINFSASAKATTNGVTSTKPLEMALALDNTGSMSANMADLKAAAKNLVQTVMNGGGGAARVSVVPYVAVVNPGLTDSTSRANYIDTTAVNPWNGSWIRDSWITQASGCTPSWGGSSGGTGSGGSGDARDILDILKPIRNLAQELFGVSSAHAADVTANSVAPLATKTWTSSKTGRTYTMPIGFTGIAKDIWGAGSTGGCDYLSNPSVVSQYELFARTLDANGNAVAWKGCVEARLGKSEQSWLNSNWGYSYAASKDYDLTDAAPTTSDPLSLFVPYFWPDEPDYSPYTWAVVNPGAYSTTAKGFHNNYLADGVSLLPTTWGWTALDSVGWSNGQFLLKYDKKTKAAIIQETPDASGYTYGPNAGCPDPILRLTNNQGDVVSKINNLNFWQSGGTIVSEGLMWAWRTLSPNAPFADATAYGTSGVTKAIVLMTDGVNELIDNANNATSLTTANLSDYSAYGYLGGPRLNQAYNLSTYTGVNTMLNTRLATACANAKAAGVQIYTVVFNHSGYLTSTQQTNAQNLLKNCASNASGSFLATDATSLNSAFSAIALQATKGQLRLIE